MKKLWVFIMFFSAFGAISAQDTAYVFSDVTRLGTTSVKDQNASGTCWAFSANSFIESEMIRMGMDVTDVPDLSEMYVVRKAYELKGEKYIRMHGTINFGGGGAFYDVFYVLKHYGFMPEDAYTGLNYGQPKHNHHEMDAVLEAYVKALKDEDILTTAWFNGYKGILDAYLGLIPDNFVYNGKTYTPQSFASDVVKINADDYVNITSFTHHPFYSQFSIEVQDNWMWSLAYNVKMDEMVEIADYAIKNGYSVLWGADVSEVYFSHRVGVAVVPDLDIQELVVTERSRWEKVDPSKYNLDIPRTEKIITQAMRQTSFDNFKTTDDHGLHIVGIAKDQNGTEYYIVKNSWDTDNIYDGYLYVSKAFFKFKTMNFVVHKDAIPAGIKTNLGL